MSRALIVSVAISACLVSAAMILVDGCNKSSNKLSTSGLSISEPPKNMITPDGGKITSIEFEKFTIFKVKNYEEGGFSVTLVREKTGKLVSFRSDESCANIDKIDMGKTYDLRYAVIRYKTFPAQSERVYGGEIICPT